MADHKIYGRLIVAGKTSLEGELLSELKLGDAATTGVFHVITIDGVETDRGIDLVLKGAGFLRVPEGYESAIDGQDRALVNKKYTDSKIGGHATVMDDPNAVAILWRDHADDTIKFATLHESLDVAEGVLGVVEGKTVQKVTVRKNNDEAVGAQPVLRFIEGSNVSIAIQNDTDVGEIKITISASGGGGGAMSVTKIGDEDLTTGKYDVPAISGLYIYQGTVAATFNLFLPSNEGTDVWIKNISDADLLVRSVNANELLGAEEDTGIQLKKGMVLHLIADGTHHQIMQS